MTESEIEKKVEVDKLLPLIPLRDIVIFPGMIVPLFIGRQKSILAIEKAITAGQSLVFVTQKDSNIENPEVKDLFDVGVIGKIIQILKLPDNTVKILIEAQKRVQLHKVILDHQCFYAEAIELIDDEEPKTVKLEALTRTLLDNFAEYVQLNKKINPEILITITQIKEAQKLCDTVSNHIIVDIKQKQQVLATIGIAKKLDKLIILIENEINVLNTEKKIRLRIKKQMDKVQKDYYLNEQMKAIQKELNETETGKTEFEEISDKINSVKLSKEAKEKANSELKKLKAMSNISAEAAMVRNYLDLLLSLPWGVKEKVKQDINHATKILEKDHYGLEKVKERILEYLAVQQKTNSLKGPIICLVGPPGVGKTSLAKSIAEATSRKFVRFALGGLRDEAEIRGHRKTYVGAMPGKIIQLIKKAKSSNPVFLLDEIDKLGYDRGDPAAALLEVLDPEQNNKFIDNYLEVEFDLSNIFFVATANSLQTIPRPLLDRMEVIKLSGYTEDEKTKIATKYLVKKQKKENGLEEDELSISPEVIRELIQYYTREAGVRGLEKEISKICRKIVKNIIENKVKTIHVTTKNLEKFCGIRKFNINLAEINDQVGVVTGLAYTEVGGDMLSIESVLIPGKGQIKITGKLGEVMQESAQAAFSFFKSQCLEYGVIPPFYQKKDLHLHVPEGAVPKDGPSAGIAILTSIVSTMTGIPINKHVAMTGEITLRGKVLAIGGLKEKLLAALRGGIKTVIIPLENKKDISELPTKLIKSLEIHYVAHASEVLKIALTRPLVAKMWLESDHETSFILEKEEDKLLTH